MVFQFFAFARKVGRCVPEILGAGRYGPSVANPAPGRFRGVNHNVARPREMGRAVLRKEAVSTGLIFGGEGDGDSGVAALGLPHWDMCWARRYPFDAYGSWPIKSLWVYSGPPAGSPASLREVGDSRCAVARRALAEAVMPHQEGPIQSVPLRKLLETQPPAVTGQALPLGKRELTQIRQLRVKVTWVFLRTCTILWGRARTFSARVGGFGWAVRGSKR